MKKILSRWEEAGRDDVNKVVCINNVLQLCVCVCEEEEEDGGGGGGARARVISPFPNQVKMAAATMYITIE